MADNQQVPLFVSHRILFDELCRRIEAGSLPEDGDYFCRLATELKDNHNAVVTKWRYQRLAQEAAKLVCSHSRANRSINWL